MYTYLYPYIPVSLVSLAHQIVNKSDCSRFHPQLLILSPKRLHPEPKDLQTKPEASENPFRVFGLEVLGFGFSGLGLGNLV